MQISFHLSFRGQCQEAFEFYAELLGGSFTMFTYGDSPSAEQVPAAWRQKIIHASLKIYGMEIDGADFLPEQYEESKGYAVMLKVAQSAEAERLFQAFSKDGKVHMPIQKTFFSPAYGKLVDRFGIPWEIYSVS